MPKYNVTVVGTVYADYTVTADTAEDAKELAEQAFVDDDIFETLAAVQDGRLVKDDQGIISIDPDEVTTVEVSCAPCAPCSEGEHATIEPDEAGIERCTCCGEPEN
jgi:hypothetical protein